MTTIHGNPSIGRVKTTGESSPGVVYGPVTYVTGGENRSMLAEFSRPRPSRVGAGTAAVVASVSSAVSAACSAWALLVPAPLWSGVVGAEGLDLSAPLFSGRTQVFLFALVIGVMISVLAWRAFWRRKNRLPKIAKKGSLFRSLIPLDPDSGRFVRTNASVRCPECARDHRDVVAKIRRSSTRQGGLVHATCRLGHRLAFRENSLFVGKLD